MALKDLIEMADSSDIKRTDITEERIMAIMRPLRQYIAFWREYPDLFVDFLCGGDNAAPETLHLFFYQRVWIKLLNLYWRLKEKFFGVYWRD